MLVDNSGATVPESHRLLALARFLPIRGECAAASIISEARLATRLLLLCSGPTTSSRTGAFPAIDEPLDEGGLRKARGRNAGTPPPDLVLTSPARVARDTASALGLESNTEAALADIDHGAWSGCSLADLQSAEPDALASWFTDPSAGAPGGETMQDVARRVGPWLDIQAGAGTTVMGITHAAVIRAGLAHALKLPVRSTLQIDIAPLSVTTLSFNGIWRLQELRRV